MKIALHGYGKMGKEVHQAALEKGHDVVVGLENVSDVLIDFTGPNAVVETAKALKNKPIPWVLGTTGWDLDHVLPLVQEGNIPLLYGPNFSLGVAIFSRLAKHGAKMMAGEFVFSGVETHHTEKKDVPSGTAKKLMGEIEGLSFESIRKEGECGTHALLFDGACDQIEIVHRAKNRKGFAMGAVLAAEWLFGKEGIYTFDDYVEEMWRLPERLQPL